MSKPANIPLIMFAGVASLFAIYGTTKVTGNDLVNAVNLVTGGGLNPNEAKIMKLNPAIRGKVRQFIALAKSKGIDLRITSGLRDYAEQARLYALGIAECMCCCDEALGRTEPGNIVTNAKPGESSHNFGTAIDVVPFVNGKPVWESPRWNEIGALGKSLGFKWGGDFTSINDRPHFEMNFGNTLAQLRAKKNSGNVDSYGYVKLAA